MFDLTSIAVGAAGVGLAYFLYLAASKGLPAAVAWFKAKWTAGKTELATLKSDISDAQTKVAALETSVIVDIKARLAALEGKLAIPAPAAAPAPAAPAQA